MAEQKVDVLSETWQSVLDSVHKDLNDLRKSREQFGADLRQLDRDLGGIKSLEKLLELPASQVKKPPEPIRKTGVGVPGLKHPGDLDG